MISGIPTTTGSFSFTVLVTDSLGTPTSQDFSISIQPAITVTVSPGTATLSASQTQQFTAIVTGTTNTAVTWSRSPNVGSISSSGLYTAPSSISSSQTVTVTATSVADSTKSDSATVTLSPSVSVTVSPPTVSLSASQTQQFTATVTGSTNTAVTWSRSPNVGSISSSGLYTAPSSISSSQTVTVTATSVADPSQSDSATVTLSPTVSVAVSPPTVTLSASQTQQFTATVTGSTNTAVTWSHSPGVGSISATGLYTAPAIVSTPQTITITAISVADPTKSAAATVNLIPTVSVTINPPSVTLSVSQSQQFTATVTGASDTTVTWSRSPNVGTISNTGLFTAPASISTAQAVTITATSVADSTKSASATVNLSATVSVTITPSSVTLSASQTRQFTATVAGTANTAVTWSLSPDVGSISAGGLYTAPSPVTATRSVTVTATSVADVTKSASAVITLVPSISVTLSPSSVTLGPSQTRQFTATISGTSNTSVTWSISPTVGTISGTGLYTAPATIESAQTVVVAATSVEDPTKSDFATVNLSPSSSPVSVTVRPTAVALASSQSQQFTATVSGSANTAVTWSLNPTIGAVSGTGLYTAPGTIDAAQTITLTATSVADPSKSATAAINLLPAVQVTVSPVTVTLTANQTQQFTAAVTGAANLVVTWSVNPNVGTVSSAGVYTAPSAITSTQAISVIATSVADPAVSHSATVILSMEAPGRSLTAAPTQLSFSYRASSPEIPAAQSISVFSDAGSIEFKSINKTGEPWLRLSGSAGQTPGAVRVSVNPAGLAPGVYRGTVSIRTSETSALSVDVPVELSVEAVQPPKLTLSPLEVRFALVEDAGPTRWDLQVSNDGDSRLDFVAQVQALSGGSNWLRIETSQGSLDARSQTRIPVTVDPSAVPPGTYRGRIEISGAGQVAGVNVVMAVSRSGQTIQLSQSGLEFTATPAVSPSEQRFAVLNTGAGAMAWRTETEVLSGGEWLRAAPSSGTSIAGASESPLVSVTVNPQGLTPGTYHGSVRILAGGAANSPQSVAVVMRVFDGGAGAPPPLPSTSGVLLEVEQGQGETQQPVVLQNLGDNPVVFATTATTEDARPWFSAAASGVIPARNQLRLVLQSKLAGLAPGAYRGALRIAFVGGNTQTVEVRALVTAATASPAAKGEPFANPNCVPSKLVPVITSPQLSDNFRVRAGNPVDIEVRLVDDCGNPINQAVMVIKPTAPYKEIVLVHRGSGIWAGTWVPLNEGPSHVDLKLAALHFQINRRLVPDHEIQRSGDVVPSTETAAERVLNSASYAPPQEIALGSWVSIFGDELAEREALVASPPYLTELSGVQVALGEQALPLQYVSKSQINALIPTALSPNTLHQLQVKRPLQQSVGLDVVVSEFQPGIYTLNQQGSGQGAVLTSDNVLAAPLGTVNASRPARRGETIQIFATGLGLVTNQPALGEPAPTTPPFSETLVPPIVTVGGQQAVVQFSGLAPGFVGLYQVNAVVPDTAPPGDAVPMTIQLGPSTSNTVTIAIE